MISPRRRQDKPIRSVALKISVRTDKETAAKIREAIPSAVVRGGACQITIDGSNPTDVADRARSILERVRPVL